MTKLKTSHKVFVQAYVDNGFNATQAYLRAYPNVSNSTARTNGTRLLTYAYIDDEIKRIINLRGTKSDNLRQSLTKRAREIENEARSKGNLQIALNAIKLQADMNHVFIQSEEHNNNYEKLLRQLVVEGDLNINVNPKEKQQVINISPS